MFKWEVLEILKKLIAIYKGELQKASIYNDTLVNQRLERIIDALTTAMAIVSRSDVE